MKIVRQFINIASTYKPQPSGPKETKRKKMLDRFSTLSYAHWSNCGEWGFIASLIYRGNYMLVGIHRNQRLGLSQILQFVTSYTNSPQLNFPDNKEEGERSGEEDCRHPGWQSQFRTVKKGREMRSQVQTV